MALSRSSAVNLKALTLQQPSEKLQRSYNDYIIELKDEERYPYPLDLPHHDFTALITTLQDYSLGKNLPSWLVPNTTYWLLHNNEIVGCSHLRHELNEALRQAGGHIGLGIRPAYRGKGLGKVLLQKTLEKAKEKHIQEVHIHCYGDNVASMRMIESVGATIHSAVAQENSNQKVLRYIFNTKALR